MKQVLTMMPQETLEQKAYATEAQCGIPGGDWESKLEPWRATDCGNIGYKR